MDSPAFAPTVPLARTRFQLPSLRKPYQVSTPTRTGYVRNARSVNGLRMQTWSDPAVTAEYFDFLEGRNQRDVLPDCQSTIVGAGRIGSFLAENGMNDLVLKRGESIPPDAPGPVYVCTRNEDLMNVILSCPPEKKEDLVFLQNGFLERFLRQAQCDKNTKVNCYFAISKLGAKPIDGITETDPEGLTTVCGKWESAFSERLERAGLTCKILKERDFRRSQMEKLIWICAFNLIGAVHGNISMGEVARFHVKEATEMSKELASMIRFTLTVGMLPNIEERLLAYARRVKDFPTGMKEFKWRNGFFYDYSQLAINNKLPDPTPMHTYVISLRLLFFKYFWFTSSYFQLTFLTLSHSYLRANTTYVLCGVVAICRMVSRWALSAGN